MKKYTVEKLESLLQKSFLANTLAKKEKREEILKLQLKIKKELDKIKKKNCS
jgi:hypothetical protein